MPLTSYHSYLVIRPDQPAFMLSFESQYRAIEDVVERLGGSRSLPNGTLISEIGKELVFVIEHSPKHPDLDTILWTTWSKLSTHDTRHFDHR